MQLFAFSWTLCSCLNPSLKLSCSLLCLLLLPRLRRHFFLGILLPIMMSVLVSSGCCNKVPQTVLTTGMHCLLVLEAVCCAVLCCHFIHVWLFVTPWTLAHQAPLSMGFSRQEYWNGLPCSPPGDLPDPGIKPASSALAGRFFTTNTPWEALVLEAGSLKSRCHQGWFLLRAVMENLF